MRLHASEDFSRNTEQQEDLHKSGDERELGGVLGAVPIVVEDGRAIGIVKYGSSREGS